MRIIQLVWKACVVALVFFLGCFAIHFIFIMGVDYHDTAVIEKQCQEYAKSAQVTYVKAMNTYYSDERDDNVVCVIDDLYEKLAFVRYDGVLMETRNYRSYQKEALQDKGEVSLAMYAKRPVYIVKYVNTEVLRMQYYDFDTLSLLLETDNTKQR